MPELVVLGSAASVPDADHDTVSLLLRGPGWAVPVDCGGSPLHKLARLGVERDHIRAVVLTHRHADHLYGLPILVQGLWLGGREASLPIYGPAETLDVAQELLDLFTLAEREGCSKSTGCRFPCARGGLCWKWRACASPPRRPSTAASRR